MYLIWKVRRQVSARKNYLRDDTILHGDHVTSLTRHGQEAKWIAAGDTDTALPPWQVKHAEVK